MGKTFRPWDVDQGRLFPPAPKDRLPARHLAHFILEVVREELDLSAICTRDGERRIDACIATDRQMHGSASATDDALKKQGPRAEAMRIKLRAGGFTGPYRLRKQVVEPVFG
jgi:hypothetical protein